MHCGVIARTVLAEAKEVVNQDIVLTNKFCSLVGILSVCRNPSSAPSPLQSVTSPDSFGFGQLVSRSLPGIVAAVLIFQESELRTARSNNSVSHPGKLSGANSGCRGSAIGYKARAP